MNNNKLQIETYTFNYAAFLKHGFSIFSRGAGSFIGFTILYFLILILSPSIIRTIPLPKEGIMGEISMEIVSGFLNIFLQILLAGLYIYARKLEERKEEFNNFFKGFTFYKPIAIYSAIFIIINTIVSYFYLEFFIPEGLIEILNNEPNKITENFPYYISLISEHIDSVGISIKIIFLSIVFILIYLTLSYQLTIPLIVDAKLNFWDAMETSRKIIGSNFIHFLGLYFLILLAGTILSVITIFGIIIIYPLIMCINFAVYDSIVGPYLSKKDNFN